MIYAHTLGTGGPDLELFMFAAALLVLGVVLFLQKSTKPIVSVVLLVAAFAVGTGAFALGGSSTTPTGTVAAPKGLSVKITAPEDGSSVPAGRPLSVETKVTGGELTTASQASDPTQGHLHVFVDDQLVSMPTTSVQELELEPGKHTIVVEFTTADHRSFDPRVSDTVEVTAK
jgi:Domain of unknown function (DUF4399)/Family of unknown function (DUF6130)